MLGIALRFVWDSMTGCDEFNKNQASESRSNGRGRRARLKSHSRLQGQVNSTFVRMEDFGREPPGVAGGCW